MHTYEVVITYTYYGSSVTPDPTFTTERRAATPGAAAGSATAIFQALTNVTIPDGSTPPTYHPFIIVKSVVVSEVT